MTVHCWGENPRGLWTLVVTDNDNNNRKHYLEKLTKGDEEDVTRIFLDNTEKNQQNARQEHILKTMEDTAGRLFNGDGYAKTAHRKKPDFSNRNPPGADSAKTGPVRHHDVRTKGGKKHYLESGTKQARKGKQISKGLKNKFFKTAASHAIEGHRAKKAAQKYTSSKKLASKTTYKGKHRKLKDSLRDKSKDGKTILKHKKTTGRGLNNTLTTLSNHANMLNNSTASIFKKNNTSENATALGLIKKLISEIQQNPLVTKIALEALKNPAIGRLFGIDLIAEEMETNHRNASLTKTAAQEINKLKNLSSLRNSSLSKVNLIPGSKELDSKDADANRTSNENEPLTRPLRVNASKHGNVQFFQVLKDYQGGIHKTDASGSGIEDSGNYLNSGSGDNIDRKGSQNLEEFDVLKFQSLKCVGSKNCSDSREEGTAMSRSQKQTMKIATEFEGEGEPLEQSDGDSKESQSGDGDGGDFFEYVKEAVQHDEDNNDVLPEFGIDVKSVIKEKIRPCRNVPWETKNNSFVSRGVPCPVNTTNANEREKEDKSLAHYLAVDKLKSTAEDNVFDSRRRNEESSSSYNSEGDSELKSGRDSLASKYNGKDLEVLQEALEDQLTRLSKDPNSKKSNAEILARVKEDINLGDIDDLELLESQITDASTDLSRVVRSLSPEDEKIEDADDYEDTKPETLYGEFNNGEEELEPRGISYQVRKRKSSQTYYVKPDRYGKDNSGILESWTLILYGTK